MGDESSSEDVTRRVACNGEQSRLEYDAGNDKIGRTYIIWVPRHVAHSTSSASCERASCWPSCGRSAPTVSKCNDLAFASQVPDCSKARVARACKNVCDLRVPGYRCDVLELCAARARAVWLAWIVQVPDIDFTVDSTR